MSQNDALFSQSQSVFRPARRNISKGDQQFLLICGLVEEVISAALDPVDAVAIAVQTGNQYHGDQSRSRPGLHRLTDFESGRLRHHGITTSSNARSMELFIQASECLLAVRLTLAVLSKGMNSRPVCTVTP